MEKVKKELKGRPQKSFKKKSKALLISSHGLSIKETLQDTKESWQSKSKMRKSTSNKKNMKEGLGKVGSLSNINNVKMKNQNSRYFTQAYSNKTQIIKQPCLKKLVKSSWMSPERNTAKQSAVRISKDRFSLNSSTKHKNIETQVKGIQNKPKVCEEISLGQLQEVRREIQNTVKKSSKKIAIGKKEFLKITDQYEKLINRIVFSQIVNEREMKDYVSNTYSTYSQGEQSGTFRIKQKELCPGLQLQNIKKQNIEDYNDEFMSHYNELSQSWKRDINIQRRY